MKVSRREVIAGTGAALAAAPLASSLGWAQARRVFVIATNADLASFDPHVAGGYQTNMLIRNVYESLLRAEDNPPKAVPNLAESWTVSPDGLEYVFKLRRDAKFHDGTPVDAAAVQYSFNRIMRLKKGYSWMIAGILDDKSVQVVDPQTVRFKLVKPFVAFLQALPWLPIVNPTLLEANKGTDDGQAYLLKNAAGSGPFQLRRADPGNLFEFERVANHWRTGGGNLNSVIWKIVRENATQRLMIQRGEAQLSVDLSSEDMDALKGAPGVVRIVEPEYRVFYIRMNNRFGPLMDVNLRRAVSCAFNYQAMLDVSGKDYAKLMTGPLPDGIFGFNPDLPVYRTDLAKAKEFLAKSKYPNGGVKLSIIYFNGLEQQRRWALILLDSLRQLNIDLDIRPATFPEMITAAAKPETLPDFFEIYETANYADPDNVAFAAYHSSTIGSWQNPSYSNPEVDELIAQGRSTQEEAKRKAIYQKFQEVVVSDAPDLFGVLESRRLAIRAEVKGYKFTPVSSNAPDMVPISLP